MEAPLPTAICQTPWPVSLCIRVSLWDTAAGDVGEVEFRRVSHEPVAEGRSAESSVAKTKQQPRKAGRSATGRERTVATGGARVGKPN